MPYVTSAVLNVTGRKTGYKLNNVTLVQVLFSCRLPSDEPRPTHVSFTAAFPCIQSTILLPVKRPFRSEPEHLFGACVAISFGTVPVPVFVEWIELNRMLGVSEFNVYDAGMVNMSNVFKYYTNQVLTLL